MDSQVYLFTVEEFAVLAGAVGIRSFYGFCVEVENIQKEQVLYSMQKLQNMGLLQPGSNALINGQVSEIFEVIKDVDTTIEVHKASGRTCIFYIGGRAVKMSKSMRRPDTYELMMLETDRIWRHLQEEGWIAEGGVVNDFSGHFGTGC